MTIIPKRRIFLLLLIFLLIFPISGCTSPPQVPPQSANSTPIILPFPMADAPVGIRSAEIELRWTERESSIDDVSYRGLFTADYTIRFTGEEPAIVEIAIFLPELDTRKWSSRPSPGQDFRAYLDGAPFETRTRIVPEYTERTGPEDLTGRELPVLASLLTSVRYPYIPSAFDADEPAVLYTFTVEVAPNLPRLDQRKRVRLTVFYNPEITTVVSPTSMNRAWIDRETGEAYVSFSMFESLFTDGFYGLELFVIGEDTIRWEYELDLLREVGESTRRIISDGLTINAATRSDETPRNFLRRIQREEMGREGQILMVKADERLMDPGRHNFVGLASIISELNRSNFRIPRESNVFIASIPFEPGEERVLSISFTAYSGMKWNSEDMESLFHHTILTETANYWDFFDHLTVTAHHPENMTSYAFTDGFVTQDDKSVLRLQNPDKNIHMGFVLEDERITPRGMGIGGMLVVLLLIAVVYPIINLLQSIVRIIAIFIAVKLLVGLIVLAFFPSKHKKT